MRLSERAQSPGGLLSASRTLLRSLTREAAGEKKGSGGLQYAPAVLTLTLDHCESYNI